MSSAMSCDRAIEVEDLVLGLVVGADAEALAAHVVLPPNVDPLLHLAFELALPVGFCLGRDPLLALLDGTHDLMSVHPARLLARLRERGDRANCVGIEGVRGARRADGLARACMYNAPSA